MRHSCLNILLLTYREVLSLIIHNTKKKGSQKLFKIKVITNETVVFDGSDGGGGLLVGVLKTYINYFPLAANL